MTAGVKVKVLEGWAVYDGHAHRVGGETLQVDADTADKWVAAGWVERAESPRRKR